MEEKNENSWILEAQGELQSYTVRQVLLTTTDPDPVAVTSEPLSNQD